MNQQIVSGYLGQDPDIKYVGNDNKLVVSFSIGSSYNDRTTWFQIECWGYTANRAQMLEKGDKVVVRGYTKEDKYQDENGADKRFRKVVAQELELCQKLTPPEDDRADDASAEPKPDF